MQLLIRPTNRPVLLNSGHKASLYLCIFKPQPKHCTVFVLLLAVVIVVLFVRFSRLLLFYLFVLSSLSLFCRRNNVFLYCCCCLCCRFNCSHNSQKFVEVDGLFCQQLLLCELSSAAYDQLHG